MMTDSLLKQLLDQFSSRSPEIPELELLSSVRLTGVLKGDAELYAPWGVDLPHAPNIIVLYIVTEGHCTVKFPQDSSLSLSAGDALLVPVSLPISMSDSPETPCLSLYDIIKNLVDEAGTLNDQLKLFFQPSSRYGGDGDLCRITTLRLFIDESFPKPLLKGLPKIIKNEGFWLQNQVFLEKVLSQISQSGSLGFLGQAIAIRLAESVLVSFLQSYFHSSICDSSGIHAALRDQYLAKVISAIQRDPKAPWTLKDLASIAGLSRSAFIERFTRVVGDSPIHYLFNIRMSIAANLLATSKLSISQISDHVGYNSLAAFGRAFHKWAGTTPGHFREQPRNLAVKNLEEPLDPGSFSGHA